MLAAGWAICLASGCSSKGIYSVRYHDQGVGSGGIVYEEQSIGDPGCDPCPQVSLGDAVKSLCGPPELFHDDLMHGDPGAIAAPVPKYHPLPTRPVFGPAYYPLDVPAIEMEMTPPKQIGVDPVAQRTAKWRGPLPRIAPQPPATMEVPRVARTPLDNVTFPPLEPWRVPPERIAPGGAHPLR